MGYLSVTDLKKSKTLGERLRSEREIIITREGKPMAIMIGVDGDTVESALAEIRRALFSASIGRIRDRVRQAPPEPETVESAVRAARRARTR